MSDCIAAQPASESDPRAISSSARQKVDEVEPRAADVLRIAHAEEAEAPELGEQLARERVRLVERRRLRRDALVAEARERVADLLLLVAQFEVHAPQLSTP